MECMNMVVMEADPIDEEMEKYSLGAGMGGLRDMVYRKGIKQQP